MRSIVRGVLAVVAIAGVANAAPVKLTKKQLEKVTAGRITQKTGGHDYRGAGDPKGIDYTNPQGKAPKGQN